MTLSMCIQDYVHFVLQQEYYLSILIFGGCILLSPLLQRHTQNKSYLSITCKFPLIFSSFPTEELKKILQSTSSNCNSSTAKGTATCHTVMYKLTQGGMKQNTSLCLRYAENIEIKYLLL
jgi:hypothetical protein